jgi:3-hydroxyisobutyrate dehydrogenase-like beta-hydroxyacid dehydrogenase
VVACGFKGIYVDANAISPQKVVRIAKQMVDNGVTFVDGGIIGGPAWKAGKTWLYLSGEDADQVVACFSNGPLETEIVGEEIGLASSLKMCYAAYTKGSTALLCGILAAAEVLGVRGNLEKQWNRDGSGFANQTQQRVRRVTAKAWRFAGEMEEIAATLMSAGVPGDFHEAAAEIYRRISDFKGLSETPALEEVLQSLLTDSNHNTR